jgi:hypothetical protein
LISESLSAKTLSQQFDLSSHLPTLTPIAANSPPVLPLHNNHFRSDLSPPVDSATLLSLHCALTT